MSVHSGPHVSKENLFFCLDFGNPTYDSKELINDLPFSINGGSVTTGTNGYYNASSNEILFDNRPEFGNTNFTNGWSVIAITEWSNYAGKSEIYYGVLGTGNNYTNSSTDRLFNMYWQKNSTGLRVHHSAAAATQNAYSGSHSSYFQSILTDDQPIMTAYTNALTTHSYYIHGNFINSASVSAPRTTYPSANDLAIGKPYTSVGTSYNGKMYMILIYNKPLSAIEHKKIYEIMKPRFNLQSGTL